MSIREARGNSTLIRRDWKCVELNGTEGGLIPPSN